MDRRWNLLFLVPLMAALIAFLATQELIYTAIAFVAGYVLMEGFRFLLLPPHLHRAARQYQKGNLEEAMALTKKSIAARPDRWESHYLQALIAFNSAQLGDAEESARHAIELKPDEAAAHVVLGQVQFAQGHYDRARKSFLEAIDVGGNAGINQYHAAAAAFRNGDCDETIPRLELALRLGIDNPQLELLAKYYLGECHRRAGDEENAADYFGQMSKHADELENLRHDLQIVPDYPERSALSKDVQAIADALEIRTAEEASRR